MLSAAIAYQVLQQENPPTIEKVKTVLVKHPWYANHWQSRLQEVPADERGIVFFMQAGRWTVDIRTADNQYHRALRTTSIGHSSPPEERGRNSKGCATKQKASLR